MSSASPSAAPGARRPRRRPGENRVGLIAAGTIEFGLHGYAAAQTSAIAERAGVSQPNVYANFSSKRELFLACVRALSPDALASGTPASGTPARGAAGAAELLLYQAVAAAADAELAAELPAALRELRDQVGNDRFHQALLRAAGRLLSADPGM